MIVGWRKGCIASALVVVLALALPAAARELTIEEIQADTRLLMEINASGQDYPKIAALYRQRLDRLRATRGPGETETIEGVYTLALYEDLAGEKAVSRAHYVEYLRLSQSRPDAVKANVLAAHVSAGYIASGANEPAAAEGHFRDALGFARKAFGAQSPEALRALDGLVMVTGNQGKSRDQSAHAREAIAIRRTLQPVPELELGSSLLNLGMSLFSQGQIAEAGTALREAIDRIVRGGAADSTDAVTARSNYAVILVTQGRPKEAYAELEANHRIAVARFGPNSVEALNGEVFIAMMMPALGREGEAETLLRRVTTIAGGKPEMRTTQLAAFAALGALLSTQGRLAEAEAIQRQQLAASEQVYGRDHAYLAAPLGALASTLIKRNDLAGAEAQIDRAIAIERKQAARSIGMVNYLQTKGDIARRRGQFQLAYDLHRQAQAMGVAMTGPRGLFAVLAENTLGLLAEDMGRNDLAARHYRAAIAGGRAMGVPMVDPLANLARWTEPRESLDLAREAVALARAQRATLLSGGTGREDLRAASRATSLERMASDPRSYSYMRLADAAYLAVPLPGMKLEPLMDEAFVAIQEAHLSRAAQAMARTAARAAAGKGRLGKLVERQQELTAQARLWQDKQLEALGKGDDASAGQFFAMTAEAGVELAAIDKELEKAFPDFWSTLNPAPLPTVEVAKLLKPDEGLLLIATELQKVMIFAIGPGGRGWRRSDLMMSEITAIQKRMLCQLDDANCTDEASAQASRRVFDLEGAHRLYADLLQPMEKQLAGAKRVYVVNQGEFGRLPLSLLPTAIPPGAGQAADLAALARTEWFADRYALINLPSVASLRLAGKVLPPAPQPFIGYGAPALRGTPADPGESVRSAPPRGLADVNLLQSLRPLPGTVEELRAQAASLGSDGRAIKLGPAATETAVRADKALGQARVLTFATHSLMPGELADFDEPGLVFSPPASATPQDDGILSASEAATLTLNADWVILSACNTASGMDGAETLSGLARAFLFAGARSLLVSHWGVKDKATAALTVETLREDRTKPRGAALQSAIRTVRTGRRADGSALENWKPYWVHPSYWAGFSLIANTDQ